MNDPQSLQDSQPAPDMRLKHLKQCFPLGNFWDPWRNSSLEQPGSIS